MSKNSRTHAIFTRESSHQRAQQRNASLTREKLADKRAKKNVPSARFAIITRFSFSLERICRTINGETPNLAESRERDALLTRISALHSISVETMSILERAGSKGNSTMLRPRGVREPVLSSAPSTHSWYIEFKMLSCNTEFRNNREPVTEHRNQRELQWGQGTSVVQSSQHPQLVHRVQDVVLKERDQK